MIGRIIITLLAATSLLTASCSPAEEAILGPAAEDGLRVASFDFPESVLLAEMYSQAVELVGVPVVRLGAVGPREIIAPAMQLDRVDLVPEYLGTIRRYVGLTDPVSGRGLGQLNAALAADQLTALDPAPAQDKNVFVVTRSTSRSLNVAFISDLASIAHEQRFGGPPECQNRPLCLRGLERVYDLHFASFVPQRSLAFTAEALLREEIDVALMYSTAPQLDDEEIVVLADDLHLQPAENIIPVIRTEAISRWGPIVTDVLNEVSSRLTTTELRRLNTAVADGALAEDIAQAWLAENLEPASSQ